MFNDFFEKIYVINLEEATDRKKYVSNLLSSENISFEFFEAFNGRKKFPTDQLRLDFIKENFVPAIAMPNSIWKPSVGQIGCWMSHVNIWKHIVENNIETCLILEDDITFGVHNPNETLNNYLKDLPVDWNIFMLGFCNYNGYLKSLTKNIIQPRLPACTHAYAITKESAKILLQLYHPMKGALDYFTGHIFFSNEDAGVKNLCKKLWVEDEPSSNIDLSLLEYLHGYACAPCIFNQGGSSYSSVW